MNAERLLARSERAHARFEAFMRMMEHQRVLNQVCQPPPTVDVRAIRAATGLSRACFVHSFGLAPGAVQDWEQGRRRPDTAARTLLLTIATAPEAVDKALADRGVVRRRVVCPP